MTYQKFLQTENVLTKLLVKLEILEQYQRIIKIDNSPDPDFSSSDWREDADNYFKNSWRFSDYFNYITKFEFSTKRVYHFDHIEYAGEELKMDLDIDDIERSLNLVYEIDEDYFSSNGFDTDFNESFKLHKLKLVAIDNLKRKIWYEGGFFGNHETYDNTDWGVFAKVRLTGIPRILNGFYKELIGESYLLYNSGNYKMSYFIAYSALENYVNSNLGSEESEERFKDKLKEWLKSQFADLGKHQVYCGIIKEFDGYTGNRNTIAHGKENINIDKDQAKSILLFVATLICSFSFNLPTFEQLHDEIT